MKDNKGITLVALMLTVVVLIIIAGTTINIGTDSVDETRLQGFYTQLEVVQKRVDDIATTNEKYNIYKEDGTPISVDIKTEGGKALTEGQVLFLQGILSKEEIAIPANEFRYFTVTDLEQQLDLSNMVYNVFIHFDTRIVVSEEGIYINGENYYILKNDIYFVNENLQKNEMDIELTFELSTYGTNNYKIVVTPSTTIGDLNTTGTLKYKKTTSKYWETSNNLEIIIQNLGQYDIIYQDSFGNKVIKKISVTLNGSNMPQVREITE